MPKSVTAAAPARTDAGRAVTRRTATAAAPRVIATAAAISAGASQSWPSGTMPSSRATANGTTVASDASRPSTTPIPATNVASATTDPRTWLGVAPSSHSRASSVRRWATVAAQALSTMIAANSEIIATTTLLSRLMISVPSSGTASERWSMLTSMSVPTRRRGEDDDRGQDAAQQVGAPAGVAPARAATTCPPGRRPAAPAPPSSAPAPGRGWPGRARRGCQLLPEVAMASYGSPECAVTVIVTTRHRDAVAPGAERDGDPPPRQPRPVGRGVREREPGRTTGGPAAGDRRGHERGRDHRERGGAEGQPGRRRTRRTTRPRRPRAVR